MSNITMDRPELKTLSSLLCGAFEGLSNYQVEDLQGPDSLSLVLDDGGSLVVQDVEAGKTYELTLDSCVRGWQVMHDSYPKHWMAAQAEAPGAEAEDVFLQCCLFGEVVYG